MQWLTFSQETLDKLFHAVDTDDVVDDEVTLPDNGILKGDDELMKRCYSLCLQFWLDGVSRDDLLHYVNLLLAGHELSDEQKRHYKYMRAKYKHLRHAQRLYSHNHKAFPLFGHTTFTLGELQDAFRNGQPELVRKHGKRLKLLLSRPIWNLIKYKMIHTRLDSASGILAYRSERMTFVKKGMGKPQVSGHEFHDMRKVIGQSVSYYDTVRTLDPDNLTAYQMSRFLSAINGLMGERHDEMVADAMNDDREYGGPETIDEDTAWRLNALIRNFFTSPNEGTSH